MKKLTILLSMLLHDNRRPTLIDLKASGWRLIARKLWFLFRNPSKATTIILKRLNVVRRHKKIHGLLALYDFARSKEGRLLPEWQDLITLRECIDTLGVEEVIEYGSGCSTLFFLYNLPGKDKRSNLRSIERDEHWVEDLLDAVMKATGDVGFELIIRSKEHDKVIRRDDTEVAENLRINSRRLMIYIDDIGPNGDPNPISQDDLSRVKNNIACIVVDGRPAAVDSIRTSYASEFTEFPVIRTGQTVFVRNSVVAAICPAQFLK